MLSLALAKTQCTLTLAGRKQVLRTPRIYMQADVSRCKQMCMQMLQVFDPVEDYLKLLRTIFDFDALKALLRKPDFTFTFDGMHGVSGPYARRIFVEVALQPINWTVVLLASTAQHSMYTIR